MTAMLLGSNSLSRLRVLMTLFRLSWLLCSARWIRASAVISPSTIRSPARDSLCTLRRGGFRFILAGGGREGEPPSPARTESTGVFELAGTETDRRRVPDREAAVSEPLYAQRYRLCLLYTSPSPRD